MGKKVNKQGKEIRKWSSVMSQQRMMRPKDNNLCYSGGRARAQPSSQSALTELSLGSLDQSGLQKSRDKTKPLAPA